MLFEVPFTVLGFMPFHTSVSEHSNMSPEIHSRATRPDVTCIPTLVPLVQKQRQLRMWRARMSTKATTVSHLANKNVKKRGQFRPGERGNAHAWGESATSSKKRARKNHVPHGNIYLPTLNLDVGNPSAFDTLSGE